MNVRSSILEQFRVWRHTKLVQPLGLNSFVHVCFTFNSLFPLFNIKCLGLPLEMFNSYLYL